MVFQRGSWSLCCKRELPSSQTQLENEPPPKLLQNLCLLYLSKYCATTALWALHLLDQTEKNMILDTASGSVIYLALSKEEEHYTET